MNGLQAPGEVDRLETLARARSAAEPQRAKLTRRSSIWDIAWRPRA